MLRRGALHRVGPLDERFFFSFEVFDWIGRAMQAGLRVALVPEAKVEHAGGGTRRLNPVRARIESARDFFAVLRKDWPTAYPFIRAAYPVWNVFVLLVSTLLIFLRGNPVRWLEAAGVLAWQVCACPRGWGLSGGARSRYLRLRDGWVVREETLEGFGDFDRHFAKARVVKEYKYKRTLAVAVGERTYLVKVYKPGGWARRLKSFVFGSRARHELRMSQGIEERGIPTVPVVAAGERDQGSCVVFERLGDWADLQEVLLSDATPPPRRRKLLRSYGRYARWLHDLGVWQYDFNATNVLVRDFEFKFIDFEYVKLRPRALPAGERLYLLGKLNRIGILSRTDRLRFLQGYTDAHAAEAERLGELARQVLRQGERQRESDRDHAGERCLEENRDFGAFEEGDAAGYFRRVRADGKGDGIEPATLRGLAQAGEPKEGFRLEAAEDAIEAWKQANGRVREGGPIPLAVIRRKGESRGTLVYRA
jgi:tRNA A-37 threonylcarbamoyl transferase component Bud32